MKLSKKISSYLRINKKSQSKVKTRRKRNPKKLDPHHCRCFSIAKIYFREFETKLHNFGYSEPILEEDHGQILGLTRCLNPHYQIHVKLMRTGKIESEVEYSSNYPVAHLNQIHSFSAHAELNLLFSALQIPYKCRHIPPITCVQRQIIPAQQPTHMNTFLAVGGVAALADIIFNNGEITGEVLKVAAKELKKQHRRKLKRRRFLG